MRTDFRDFEERLYRVAETQGGCFTAKQALHAGYSYRLQHYYRARGKWDALDRGIFRLRNHPHADREDLVRWSLWSHDRSGRPQIIFSHATALSFHELGDFNPGRFHVIAPQAFRKPPTPGLVIHRASLPWDESEAHDGFWVTNPLRSLLDGVEANLEPDHLIRAIEEGIRRDLVSWPDIVRKAVSPTAKRFLEVYAVEHQIKQMLPALVN
ncbi:MAG: type IV toxin-antitoxin system AbiEi family antitoxin domain-containing protein [Candidatus Coatesbacteria bacterium]